MTIECPFKIGEQVHGWGIGFDTAYLEPGPITRLYQEHDQWFADWHNEQARHYAIPIENLVSTDTLMSFGLDRALKAKR